ncbi:hypothetical protein [Acetomicrobium sp.]|uniref:succinate--CoA ligase subunit alpha n=1 Tax=Acetomicrobium sp. TaxID=1872099 RepID=UPI002FC80B90
MAILIDKNTRVLVQGTTGRSGGLQTQTLIEYGTRVVTGVTPGKGGMVVRNVPVFNFIDEACLNHEVNAVISFVPTMVAKDAAFEVIDNGIPLLVLTMEGVPQKDVNEILSYASGHNTRVIGPGAARIVAPGKCKLGAHPARMFKEGHIGVVSKSGALSYEMGKRLTEAGIGQSTVVALGGGSNLGNQSEGDSGTFPKKILKHR